ncbi:MAG: ABC transporter substrate-binding protein [Deltaproteobacteria bacterium]|nr:ABC transporter substrate-binding protein [Deltaproteobacteria bacterium]
MSIQALTAGDPPIVTVGNVIIAGLQGHDIVLVASVANACDQTVQARLGTMTRIEQVKGKRFGISGFGSATHNAALILFKRVNIDPKDVTLVPTGTGPERLVAMGAGRIDATIKSLAKYMRTNDVEVLEYSYQHYLKRTPRKPYPTMKGIQNLVDMSAAQMPQGKTAKPEQFVDLSLLQKLENERFFDEMGKRYKN